MIETRLHTINHLQIAQFFFCFISEIINSHSMTVSVFGAVLCLFNFMQKVFFATGRHSTVDSLFYIRDCSQLTSRSRGSGEGTAPKDEQYILTN